MKLAQLLLCITIIFTLTASLPQALVAQEGYNRQYFSNKKAGELTLAPFKFHQWEAESGRLIVRENRSKKNTNLIEIAFVRLPAKNAAGNPPLVYLAGTGSSGIDEGGGPLQPLFQKLSEFTDVILVDTRGLGRAQPNLKCPGSITLPFDRPVNLESVINAYDSLLSGAKSYWENEGVDVYAYNTYESATDVAALLEALDIKKATFMGFSYGTHLVLNIVKRFPELVNQAVLVGTEGPDHTYKLPSNIQHSIELISQQIDADPEISREIPDFLALMREVTTTLKSQPQKVRTKHPRTGEEVEIVIGIADLFIANKLSLKHRERISTLPYHYYLLSQGNFNHLARLAMNMRTIRPRSLVPYIMDCASGVSATRMAQIELEKFSFLMGDFYNIPKPEICLRLNVPLLDDDFRTNPISDIPTLFVHHSLDIHTPLSNVEEVMAGFANGHLLTVKNEGHSLYAFSKSDFQDRIIDFITNRKLDKEHSVFELAPIKYKQLMKSKPAAANKIPLPNDITIMPPSPDLPKALAAISGHWEGSWELTPDFKLIVSNISTDEAEIIYAFNSAPRWRLEASYQKLKAEVVNSKTPTITWGNERIRFEFTLNENRDTIQGQFFVNGKAIQSASGKKIE